MNPSRSPAEIAAASTLEDPEEYVKLLTGQEAIRYDLTHERRIGPGRHPGRAYEETEANDGIG